jgi:DNA-directed RNA polymerase subunit RPC12/RpoP
MEFLYSILGKKPEPAQSHSTQEADEIIRILNKPWSNVTIENRRKLCESDDRAIHLSKDIIQRPMQSEIPKKTVPLTAMGNTEPVCPYCNFKFDKMPQKNKKCPNCSNFIICRNRPFDSKNVLLREDQMNELGAQWSAKLAPKDFLPISEDYVLEEAQCEIAQLKK